MRTLDRRVVYLLVLLALGVPLFYRLALTPARMKAAETFFRMVDEIQGGPGKLVLIGMDYGPNLQAENGTQAATAIEHLMRRRIPFAVFALTPEAEPFLVSTPERVAAKLSREIPGESWQYGTDWVNLGFRPGQFIFIQSLAKSDNIIDYLKKDALGNNLNGLPISKSVKTIEDVPALLEFTGLVGVIDIYIQFLQRGTYHPPILHGCTSITIPDSFIYLDSGQLKALLEGIAGAAWYSKLLSDHYPNRAKDDAQIINTGIGIAHLVLIALIVLGNIAALVGRARR